jgi:flagellar protein FlaI
LGGIIKELLLRYARRRAQKERISNLLIELLQSIEGETVDCYQHGPFSYSIIKSSGVLYYQILPQLSAYELEVLRNTVLRISDNLSPDDIEPMTFDRLIDALSQAAAAELARVKSINRVRHLSLLAAFEAIGIPTIFALALDRSVTEFYADSPDSPLYLDHAHHGRCESIIYLTERERKAIETHMDTFKGYTLDFSTPSLKNELEISGTKLRISLDLAPLAVNSFALDVRKLNSSSLTLKDLIIRNVISTESAAFLLAVLEYGANVTIVGETGTGKTTLLNALDESLDPRLRRIYIEDAVETRDLIGMGYHQMKLKVDPFERASDAFRTKTVEIVKILHRSPDLVILGEIQSSEHSQAFFHALSSGIRGMQTFHASSPEQAIRRWIENHRISKTSLLDLDIIVQMIRPARLGSERHVSRISVIVEESNEPRIRDVYIRDRSFHLQKVLPWERIQLRRSSLDTKVVEKIQLISSKLEMDLVREVT